MEKKEKGENSMILNPTESGHFQCPYCGKIMTLIFNEKLLKITDYICHICKKGFEVKPVQKRSLEAWIS